MRLAVFGIGVAAILAMAGCASSGRIEEGAALSLRKASFSQMPSWSDDRQAEALAAFGKSCGRILKKPETAPFGGDGLPGGTFGDWQPACRAAQGIPGGDDAAARAFFERWFQPWQATAGGRDTGLFTGYYEASLKGSRTRHAPYLYPLRARPGDLVTVDLGEFSGDLKGRRIAGRVVDGALKPYPDNRAIVRGGLPAAEDRPIVFVDDPVDAFFLQIQGSGVVDLDDGTSMRVGYAAQNGRKYYAIGRELVKRGELGKDAVSMDSIRAWLDAHPGEADDLMFTNPSYVFFKESAADGPVGGEGVTLTPGRSLAVDRGKLPYGIPVWIDAEAPLPGEAPLRRLMVAQDTGGAIVGAVRGDYFWGHGADAERHAGPMKSEGRLWLLLPRTVSP